MRRLAMGIVVLTLSPHGAMALTFTDVPSDEAIETGLPATPGRRDQFVAPNEPVRTPAPAAAPSEARRPSGNPLWAIPLRTLSGTRERPIFSSSRRPRVLSVAAAPVPKAAPAPKPKEPETPKLALVGTVAANGESFGIFLDPSTKVAFRLKAGDYYQGWKLGSIRGREAILEKDEQNVTLALPQPGAMQQPEGILPPPTNRLLSAISPPRRERPAH